MNAKKYVLKQEFVGFPKLTDVEIVEEKLSPLKDGESPHILYFLICQPKEGETVVVTGAAGAVGSHVGQIAKIKGCKVIGIVESDSKGKWITEDLGFDQYLNYKNANIKEQLAKYAPKGIDCYFDNVGGEISNTIISMMNQLGRISVCGCISQYNESKLEKVTVLQKYLVLNMLRMQGVQQNLKWVKEGKLKYKETIAKGFENTYPNFSGHVKRKKIWKSCC